MLQNEYLLAEVGGGLLLPIGNNLPNLNQNTIKFAKIANSTAIYWSRCVPTSSAPSYAAIHFLSNRATAGCRLPQISQTEIIKYQYLSILFNKVST